jgi:hypothetical protein
MYAGAGAPRLRLGTVLKSLAGEATFTCSGQSYRPATEISLGACESGG